MKIEKLIPLNKGYFTTVDPIDYHFLSQFTWHISDKGYARTLMRPERKIVRMHRLILNAPPTMQVDHIDGNPLNNCRDNLRLATHIENSRNRMSISKKYRYKGIVRKNYGFRAQIWSKGKVRYSKTFATQELAAVAYNEMALELFGEFANLNKIED